MYCFTDFSILGQCMFSHCSCGSSYTTFVSFFDWPQHLAILFHQLPKYRTLSIPDAKTTTRRNVKDQVGLENLLHHPVRLTQNKSNCEWRAWGSTKYKCSLGIRQCISPVRSIISPRLENWPSCYMSNNTWKSKVSGNNYVACQVSSKSYIVKCDFVSIQGSKTNFHYVGNTGARRNGIMGRPEVNI